MSGVFQIRGRQIGAAAILGVLLVVMIAAALIAPQESGNDVGGASSYSAAPGGARMAYELAERMGWAPSRRNAPLDAAPSRAVQVVVAPAEALGGTEVHRLLENVRRGGGLIFDAPSGVEIADSLGIMTRRRRTMMSSVNGPGCRVDRTFGGRLQIVSAPSLQDMGWRRPPPGVVRDILLGGDDDDPPTRVGMTFPLGAGRIVVLASPALIQNYAIRVCSWRADIAAVRALEAAWPMGADHPRLVFDEFHHGRGAHGGSLVAASRYLAHTASGRFLAQLILAGLALLLASAPRPIVPEDPVRIQRRSPLEHADALAHAYSDVRATRTATLRLVSGLRRRVGRVVHAQRTVDDEAFLAGAALRAPAAAASIATVRRALTEPLSNRELPAVAEAILDIERQLTRSPSPRS